MIDHEATRRRDDMFGEHTRPRVYYSAPPPNSWRDGVGGCSGRRVACEGSVNSSGGFTLAELLVSIGVLVLLILLATQLLNSAATITTLGHKQMGADSQARQLLDRMAVDFAQMVKRSDVDYFAKGTAAPNSVGGAMSGNDRIAFFSGVSGYYPTPSNQSPISLVAYRVNSDSSSSNLARSYNKLERMGKGFIWNGVSSSYIPMLFLDSATPPANTIANKWAAAASSSTADADYEIAGPQVFRFEYYYLLKNGSFSGIPWDGTAHYADGTAHNKVDGMQDVAAVIADIAVIDPQSKVLLTEAQITTPLASGLVDYAAGMTPGQLRANWQTYLDGITSLPRPAISGVRLYERYFYLSSPSLLAP